MADTLRDIVTDALLEIEAYGPGDLPVSASDAKLAMRITNRELDAWAGRKAYVYTVTFNAYTLTPNHQPHLIGPGLAPPDYAATQRPQRIEGANLILNTVTPNVDLPINIRDAAWWDNERIKDLKTNVPTDLYYSPDWPNGSLWLWPIPNFPYGLRLECWGLIPQFVSLDDPFSLPPGYRKALVLTSAERYCRPWGRPAMPDLIADAKQARSDIQTNNVKSPRISSADYGASGSSSGRRPGFNYYSGM